LQNHLFPFKEFADILEANKLFTKFFPHSNLTGIAKQGIAIVTCMDSRISPLAAVGMKEGDAKILRNAGARVTDDVLRTLVLATHLLGVNRILIMPHTNCRMAISDETDIHLQILKESKVDTRSLEFKTTKDQRMSLAKDLIRIRSFPFLPPGVVVGGMIYDVVTGELEPVNY
jgi:carbonic anhydrase